MKEIPFLPNLFFLKREEGKREEKERNFQREKRTVPFKRRFDFIKDQKRKKVKWRGMDLLITFILTKYL